MDRWCWFYVSITTYSEITMSLSLSAITGREQTFLSAEIDAQTMLFKAPHFDSDLARRPVHLDSPDERIVRKFFFLNGLSD